MVNDGVSMISNDSGMVLPWASNDHAERCTAQTGANYLVMTCQRGGDGLCTFHG